MACWFCNLCNCFLRNLCLWPAEHRFFSCGRFTCPSPISVDISFIFGMEGLKLKINMQKHRLKVSHLILLYIYTSTIINYYSSVLCFIEWINPEICIRSNGESFGFIRTFSRNGNKIANFSGMFSFTHFITHTWI